MASCSSDSLGNERANRERIELCRRRRRRRSGEKERESGRRGSCKEKKDQTIRYMYQTVSAVSTSSILAVLYPFIIGGFSLRTAFSFAHVPGIEYVSTAPPPSVIAVITVILPSVNGQHSQKAPQT